MSHSAYKYVQEFYEADLIEDEGEKYYDTPKLKGEGVRTKSESLALRANISNQTYTQIS